MLRMKGLCAVIVGYFVSSSLLGPTAAHAQDPWADRIVGYVPGTMPVPGYTNPQTAIGSPERFTGELAGFPGVVSMFSPPFGTDELVSIGEGGSLTVEFFEPVTNDPTNPFGVDLIVFGNGGFVDVNFPNGRIGAPPTTFGFDAMRVSVSADGARFVELPGEFTEGFFPAQGYLDSGPFDPVPGRMPTDFTRPVDSAHSLNSFSGLTLAEALLLYDGSGGGTPIDIAAGGLSSIRFVRIDVFDDGNPMTDLNVEIDALATVPEPATAAMLGLLALSAAFRRRRALCSA